MSERTTQSVEAIFLQIADLPPEDRSAALIERCGGDEQLRARVQRLLQADDANRTDNTLSVPAADLGADQTPSRVGGYLVSGIAGEGGTGAVYDAVHHSTRRRAAVKLLRAGIATAHGRQRMQIEAESLGRLNDPGIAQLYDAGLAEVTWPDGTHSRRPFIAMEFVQDAVSVTQFSRRKQLSTQDCIKLIARVARAVHHAHQRGVIHRDLKPGNVLINQSSGIPKIVDFGIARLIDTDVTGVTMTGQVVGTVRYMSPEQAGGEPKLIDTRTDIYSLGAILYELLTDRPMIDPDSGSTIGAVVQLLNVAPKRLASVKTELRGDVDAIVHKAIERNPDDRYASAAAFADDLERFLDGREVSARAPTTVELFVRVVKRNKAKVAAAALVLLSLVGGVIGATWGMIHADRARRAEAEQRVIAQQKTAEAEKETASARAAEADATAFGDFLERRVLATARPKDVQGGLGVDATIAEALHVAETKLEDDFANRPGAEALTRHAIGVTWRQRGDFAAAERHFRRAIELADRAFGPEHPITLNMRNSLQVLLEQAHRRGDDLSEPERILKDLEQSAGMRDPRTVTARYNLAIYRAKAGQYAAALPLLERVYDDRKAIVGENAIETLTTLNDIAEINQHLGNSEKALAIQQDLISKFTTTLGENNPQTLNARYRLACLYMFGGKTQQAVDEFDRVVPKLRKAMGDQNVTTLDALLQLAKCLLKSQQYDRAVPLFREYAAGQGKLMGERSQQTARLLNKIAVALLDSNQPKSAEEFARKQVELQQQLTPDAGPLFEAQCLLGETLAAMGSHEEAEELLSTGLAGLDRQDKLPAPLELRRQRARAAMIRILESTNRTAQADELRHTLATSQPATLPSTHP